MDWWRSRDSDGGGGDALEGQTRGSQLCAEYNFRSKATNSKKILLGSSSQHSLLLLVRLKTRNAPRCLRNQARLACSCLGTAMALTECGTPIAAICPSTYTLSSFSSASQWLQPLAFRDFGLQNVGVRGRDERLKVISVSLLN